MPRLRSSSALLVSLTLVIGCSDTADDEPGTGGGGTTAATSTSSASQGGGGGGGATEPGPADFALAYLTGRFDSSAQADVEPTYFPIQLYTCPVDAPDLGERVLYVEQARLDALDMPYRQRLYVVEPGADVTKDVVSRVFELTEPDSWIGQCDDPAIRSALADEAIARDGCEVYLTQDASGFTGGTQGHDCESTLNGASYATSVVTLTPELLESWDQGWDASDAQVWGAVDGPYIFDRKTPAPQP